jgi:hypothetical protein
LIPAILATAYDSLLGSSGPVGHVTVVQDQATTFLVRVLIEVIDPVGIEQRGTTLDAVDFIALRQQ